MDEPRFIEIGGLLINLNHVAYIQKFGTSLGIAIVSTPGEAPWDLILEGEEA